MRHILFSIGFRPFYLLAGLFAVFAVPLWAYLALGGEAGSYFSGMLWHSHEMIFGFASAVIAGFLLTAVRNWTGLETPNGTALAALVALWLVARILALSPFHLAAAVADLLFLPLLAVGIGIPIARSKNRRNFFVLVLLMLFWLADLLFLGEVLWPQAFSGSLTVSKPLAFDMIMLLLAVIGGRVIPFFSGNAIPNLQPARFMAVEIAAIGAIVIIAILEPFRVSSEGAAHISGIVMALAALVHLIRLVLWRPWMTWRQPLLLILPLSYLWIPISLAFRAASVFDGPPEVFGFHALAIGAMASMMLGMMIRSARGHTGRSLVAGKDEILAFVLIQLAAVTRVIAPQLAPSLWALAIAVTAACWTIAFLLFLIRFAPILTGPRADGRQG